MLLILLHRIQFKFSYEFLLLFTPDCVLHFSQVGTHLERAILCTLFFQAGDVP
jgi:hypothetical protein